MSRKVARDVAFKITFGLPFQPDEEAIKLFENLQSVLEEKSDITKEDQEYIIDIITGIQKNTDNIDEKIKAHLKDWSFERISKVDIAILRLAIYEIGYREDIPYKVSVNEAVELAKVYSEDSSPAFINGILAEIIKEIGQNS